MAIPTFCNFYHCGNIETCICIQTRNIPFVLSKCDFKCKVWVDGGIKLISTVFSTKRSIWEKFSWKTSISLWGRIILSNCCPIYLPHQYIISSGGIANQYHCLTWACRIGGAQSCQYCLERESDNTSSRTWTSSCISQQMGTWWRLDHTRQVAKTILERTILN